MADPLRCCPVTQTPAARLLRGSPRLVLVLLVLPVVAGIAGTVLPAFGMTSAPGLDAFRALAAWPGLPGAAALSLATGLLSTMAALGLTVLMLATLSRSRAFMALRGLLAPLLAIPHAAAALGLAFLIAPSGWLARVLSPWATGWDTPPDLLILNDPWGLSLTFGLIAKELPFLLLMALAALPQCDATRRMQVARTMGYGEVAGFCLTVVPALYPMLRLPVLAVLAYGMTSVDMGLILGPTRPPTLAVQITLWMAEPGLGKGGVAAAAALAQLALTLAAIGLWRMGERTVAGLRLAITWRGWRMTGLDRVRAWVHGAALGLTIALIAAVVALGVWSVAGLWPFPQVAPQGLTLSAWTEAAPSLTATSATTLAIALMVAGTALAVALMWLQAEYLFNLPPLPPLMLYLPLIVPQVCFLPGLEFLALRLNATGGLASVAAAHLIFVLPYVYLAASGPFRAWDRRIAVVAATLGASPARVFWRLRLPMLMGPMAVAAAIGVAVSVGQYLPTLMVGGGRVSTLTTEALALASGGNRRLTSAYGLLQTLWPAVGFALALTVPPVILRYWRRQGVAS